MDRIIHFKFGFACSLPLSCACRVSSCSGVAIASSSDREGPANRGDVSDTGTPLVAMMNVFEKGESRSKHASYINDAMVKSKGVNV